MKPLKPTTGAPLRLLIDALKWIPINPLEPVSVLETRTVAFIDILGFSEVVEKMSLDKEPWQSRRMLEILKQFQLIQNEIRSSPKQSVLPSTLQDLREVTVFSDSVVVSDFSPVAVLTLAHKLAAFLLVGGFLCRGGVASGEIYHRDEIVFGPGFLFAYKLECDVARYPRIIVADAVARSFCCEFSKYFPDWLMRDFDGSWFINLFSESGLRQCLGESGVNEFLEVARFHIEEGLRRVMQQKPENLGVLAKHRWLASQFNARVSGMSSGKIQPILF